MFQRLVVNCASTLLENDRIAGVESVFSKVSTQMSLLAEEMLRLFMSRPAPVVEVLRTNMPVLFTCVTCRNIHTPYFSNVTKKMIKFTVLQHHPYMLLVLWQQHFTLTLSPSGCTAAFEAIIIL